MEAKTLADPTKQSDFNNQVVANTTDVDPGHQCYKMHSLENISAGQNATIQLEYWADFEGENDGKNQSFFACADIVGACERLYKSRADDEHRHSSKQETSRSKFHASMSPAMGLPHRLRAQIQHQIPEIPIFLLHSPRAAVVSRPEQKRGSPLGLSLPDWYCSARSVSCSGGEANLRV
jgi:hypothetical protein